MYLHNFTAARTWYGPSPIFAFYQDTLKACFTEGVQTRKHFRLLELLQAHWTLQLLFQVFCQSRRCHQVNKSNVSDYKRKWKTTKATQG